MSTNIGGPSPAPAAHPCSRARPNPQLGSSRARYGGRALRGLGDTPCAGPGVPNHWVLEELPGRAGQGK